MVSYLCGKEASYRYRGDDAMPTADLTSGRRRRTFAGDCYCFNSNPSQWWMTCRGGSEGIACGSREKAKRRGEESIAIAIAREGRGIESNTCPPSSIDSHVGSTRRRSSLTRLWRQCRISNRSDPAPHGGGRSILFFSFFWTTNTFHPTVKKNQPLKHLQKFFKISLSKSSFEESFTQKSFSIYFHSPTAFLYLVYTLESHFRYLWLARNLE